MDVDELEQRASLVLTDYDGIIPYVEAFYIHSIIYSASRCLDSFARYDHLKDNVGSADELISHRSGGSRSFCGAFSVFLAKPTRKEKQVKSGEAERNARRKTENDIPSG